MKPGDKPISEMNREECTEMVRWMQDNREALRAEKIKEFKEKKKVEAVKTAKREVVVANAEALRLLGL